MEKASVSYDQGDASEDNKDGINSLGKKMVANLYKYIVKGQERYMDCNKDIFRKLNNKYVQKCSAALGLPKDTVLAILEEKKQNLTLEEKMHYQLDKSDFSVIRQKVDQIYYKDEGPTVDKVLNSVHDDITLPNLSKMSLCKVLKRMKFQYMTKNRDCLVEEDLGPWRYQYLSEIQNYRKEGKFIYYLDETWIDAGHTEKKVWQEGYPSDLLDPAEKGKMVVIGHIGSTDGFVEGALHIFEANKNKKAYQDVMNAENFEKWMKDVLPKLKKDSVIVLDNSQFHSRPLEETPNELWPKTRLQKWLQSKNIDYDPSCVRVKLVEIVMKEKSKIKEKFALDELAALNNIKICRTPLYFGELNPLQEIFLKIKSHVANNNKTFKLGDVKKFFEEGLGQVTKETWRVCIDRVIEAENKLNALGHIADDVTDRFATNDCDSDQISLYTPSDEYSDGSLDEEEMSEEEDDDDE